MPTVLRLVVVDHLLGQGGAWTDQAHLADQHVPELGQLIEAERAQGPTDRRRAIGIGFAFKCRRAHGAELENREGLAVAPYPSLTEEHWPTEPHSYGHCACEQGGSTEHQARRRTHDVYRAPPGAGRSTRHVSPSPNLDDVAGTRASGRTERPLRPD